MHQLHLQVRNPAPGFVQSFCQVGDAQTRFLEFIEFIVDALICDVKLLLQTANLRQKWRRINFSGFVVQPRGLRIRSQIVDFKRS